MRWQNTAGISAACLFAGIAIGRFSAPRPKPVPSTDIPPVQSVNPTDGKPQRTDLRNSIGELNQSVYDLVEKSDPKAVADELRGLSSGVHGNVLLGAVMQYWADGNPDAALEYAAEMTPGEGRLDFMALALSRLAKSDFEKALKWADGIENSYDREFLLASVYAGYAQTAPAAAMSAAEQMPAGNGRDLALIKVAEAWAQQDISAVFDWLETQPPNRQLKNLYGELMLAYMKQDQAEAGFMISDMSPSHQKTGLACQYSRQLAETDISAALTWAQQLPDTAAQQEAVAAAFDAWLDLDRNGAFNYALQSDGTLGTRLLKQVAVRMATDDPAAAAQTLNDFPHDVQPGTAQEISRIWASRDPQGVTGWISALSDPAIRQQAVEGAVYPLVSRDPQTAFQLAASLPDGNRYNLMRYTAKAWYEIDPYAASDAIRNDPLLNPAGKEQLLAQVSAESAPMDLVLPAK